MKRLDDPRHVKRIKIMQRLFAQSFTTQNKKSFSYKEKLENIKRLIPKIDPLIEEAAPDFPLEKIAKIDVAILRLAIFELLFEKKEPPKVIIDESVELAKQFGGEGSPGFVNGVLGHLLNSVRLEKFNPPIGGAEFFVSRTNPEHSEGSYSRSLRTGGLHSRTRASSRRYKPLIKTHEKSS